MIFDFLNLFFITVDIEHSAFELSDLTGRGLRMKSVIVIFPGVSEPSPVPGS